MSTLSIKRWSQPRTITRPIRPRSKRVAFYDDLGRYLGSASFPTNNTTAIQSKALAVNATTWTVL